MYAIRYIHTHMHTLSHILYICLFNISVCLCIIVANKTFGTTDEDNQSADSTNPQCVIYCII